MEDFIPNEDIQLAEETNELHEQIMDLTIENKSEFLSYFLNSNFVDKIDEFVDAILLSFQFRPNKLHLYIELIQSLIKIENDQNEIDDEENNEKHYSFSLIPTSILRNFVPIKVKYYYYLSFVQKCNMENIIKNEDLILKIKEFFQEYPQEIMPTAYLFLYFAPLISSEMPEFFDKQCALFTKQLETFGTFFEAKDFLTRLDELRGNDWKLFQIQAETNYPLYSIQSIIKLDDIDSFQKKYVEPNFNINQETKIHSYENIAFPEVKPTLLQLAAYYGSMKIFKFILLNGADLSIRNKEGFSFEHFAIAGGDPEMIRIFEQKGMSFQNTLKVAAQFHQNLVFQWIYDSKEKGDLNRVFLEACAANNLHAVLFLIQENVIDINYLDDEDEGCLHYAAKYGSNDVLKLLLAHKKINVNAGIGNRTPLDVASISGLKETVKLLITKGLEHDIKLNELDRTGRTPFGNAVQFSHCQLVKEMAENDSIDLNKGDFSPIQEAVKKDFNQIVEFLLSNEKVDLSIKDSDDDTLLHLASTSQKSDSLHLLLQNKKVYEQLKMINIDGNTPLHCAAEKTSPDYVAEFVEFLKVNNLITDDNQYIDINAKNNDEKTPLHLAAEKGSPKSVMLLLTLPTIDVNAKDIFQQTPLHLAAKKCSYNHMKELLSCPDIKVNSKDSNGSTPLYVSMSNSTIKGLTLLLSHPDIDINSKNKDNETPLHMAAKSFHPEKISPLLNNPNVDFSIVDKNGQTCFHKAARNPKPLSMRSFLDALLKRSQNDKSINAIELINLPDNNGATALHIATSSKTDSSVQSLLSFEGINVNAIDKNGQSPLHYAMKNGNIDIIKALLNAPTINTDILDKNGKKPIDLLRNQSTKNQIEALLNK